MLRIAPALALLILTLPSPSQADITGKPRVVDGDTIHIGKTKIRLHGIDAPEMKQICHTSKGKEQMCGQLAKQALERLVKGQEVTCEGDKRDPYKRLIAVCYVGPLNINKQMVVDGWAMAYRKYSKDYVRAETFAKLRREGLWRGEFEPPWEWRKVTQGLGNQNNDPTQDPQPVAAKADNGRTSSPRGGSPRANC